MRCRFLGLVQLYIFLFTEVDYPPSSSAIKWTRCEQLLLVLPAILTLLLFLFDLVFLIIMFKFWSSRTKKNERRYRLVSKRHSRGLALVDSVVCPFRSMPMSSFYSRRDSHVRDPHRRQRSTQTAQARLHRQLHHVFAVRSCDLQYLHCRMQLI